MPRLISRSTSGDALVLGVSVTAQVLHGVLVERTPAGPRFVRMLTHPLGGVAAGTLGAASASSGPVAGLTSDPDERAPVIHIGEARTDSADLFLASEFGTLATAAPRAGSVRPMPALDLFAAPLQAMLAEVADVYGTAPALAFVMPAEDVSYAEVRAAEVPGEKPAVRRARLLAALAESVADADPARVVFVPETADADGLRALALVPHVPDRVTASLEDLRDRLRTPAAARVLDAEASLYIGLARLVPEAPPAPAAVSPYAPPATPDSPEAPLLAPLDLPAVGLPPLDLPALGIDLPPVERPLEGPGSGPHDGPGDSADPFDGLPELPPLAPLSAAPERGFEGDGGAFDPFAPPAPSPFAPPSGFAPPASVPSAPGPPAFALPALPSGDVEPASGDPWTLPDEAALPPSGPVAEGVTLVLRIGATDTLALFLQSGEPVHVAHLSSLTAADAPETLCSRVLLVQDEQGLGDVTRLLLMSERDEADLLVVFGLFFPDAVVASLRTTLPGTLGAAATETSDGAVTAALAAALRLAGTPSQQAVFPAVNLLPRALARRRAARPLNWSVFALFTLLFVTTLLFTARYLILDERIDEARARLRQTDAVTADASVSRLQTRLDSLGQVQAGRQRALHVLDSLLVGSDRWSQTLETVSRGAASVRGLWIETWAPADGSVTLTGTATSRDRIVEIAEVTGGDLLSMTFNEIRDFPVYTFTLALTLPNELPEAARYLREAAAAQARLAPPGSAPGTVATASAGPAPAPVASAPAPAAPPAPESAAAPSAPPVASAPSSPALAAALPRR